MEKYLRGVLDEFLEEITEIPKTPASENLFTVRDKNKRELIDKTWALVFHHTVAQLIFTGIWCRNVAQTEIYFLTT